MLRVNVGLSRKLSRDYNSTGFSLNLEGELCVGPDDPETLIEKIKEFYDIAEEALHQQIDRYEGESAIASRDEQPRRRSSNASDRRHLSGASNESVTRQPVGDRNEASRNETTNGDSATNKQVQYLLNLGKRHGLTPPQLESRIETLLGKRIGVYDLTKREAGDVIDSLSQSETPPNNGNRRSRTGSR